MSLRLRASFLLLFIGTASLAGQVERHAAPVDGDDGLMWQRAEVTPLAGSHRFDLPSARPALADFAVCFLLHAAGSAGGAAGELLRISSQNAADDVVITAADGHITCRIGAASWSAAAPQPEIPAPRHVVLNIRRDPRQPQSGIWLDGIELVSFPVRPHSFSLAPRAIILGGAASHGAIADLRLYDRALDRPAILELAARVQPRPSASANAEPWRDRLAWRDGDVIALIGGSEAVALAEEPAFEALLHLSAPGVRLQFRNLAWETDTVHRQDRPLGFGSIRQQLDRIGATTILIMFGRDECLEQREAGLASFEAAMARLLSTCASITPRVAVIAAPPFGSAKAPLPDLAPLNPILQQFNAAARRAAAKHGAIFIDVWPALAEHRLLTTDGRQMSAHGQLALAQAILAPAQTPADAAAIDALRPLIEVKNRLWHDYWRPSNWAFLHGDRTAQPSSRDHIDPTKRWFPAEVATFRRLIEAQEQEIRARATELGRKLP